MRIKIRETINGPIVSDLVTNTKSPISLKWVGYDSTDTSYEAFYRLNHSKDWSEFNESLSLLNGPVLNVLYADENGNIGYRGAGHIPVRGNSSGKYPLSGWSKNNMWKGLIPYAELPSDFNPDEGFIISANNNMLPTTYPHFISDSWANPSRAKRIEQLIKRIIKSKGKLSIKDHSEIQLDTVDLSVRTILPHLLEVKSSNLTLNEALGILEKWDYEANSDSVAPTIFYLWLHHLKKLIFRDELYKYWGDSELASVNNLIETEIEIEDLNLVLTGSTSYFCNNVNTPSVESCNDVMIDALTLTIDELTRFFSTDMLSWKWGKFNCVKFSHQPLSYMKGFEALFGRKRCVGGSKHTINAVDIAYKENQGFESSFGTSFRIVMNAGKNSNTYFINSTGQSGKRL